MPTFKSRGLRGSAFEEMINRTIEYYRENELALIQKIPTPITPIELDKDRRITLGYFEKKSTVDYIGVVQGIPVCFDAKECHDDGTFPMQNIHEHQYQFMKEFAGQDGVAFILIEFTKQEEFYYLTLDELSVFYERMKAGGRKSFRRDELREEYFFNSKPGVLVPFIEMIQKDLDSR